MCAEVLQHARYRWQGVDWAAEQTDDVASLVDSLSRPEDGIKIALQAFHNRFYPDEAKEDDGALARSARESAAALASSRNLESYGAHSDEDWLNAACKLLSTCDPLAMAKTAWAGHHGAARFYEDLGRINHEFFSGASHQHSQAVFRRRLEHHVKAPWLLSWHWRAVLGHLAEWQREHAGKLVVQICQVRQWQVVLAFITRSDTTVNAVPRLSAKDLTLICPPLFSVGHRLQGWDAYRLYYHPQVREEVVSEVKRLGAYNGHSPDPYRLARVLGRHDCYYQIHDVDFDESDESRVIVKFCAHVDIAPHHHALPFGINVARGTTGSDGEEFEKPEDLIDLPAFGDHPGASCLLSSDHYCKALEQLAEVLNDPTARSVLVIAPPGSGKEELCRAAHRCRTDQGHLVTANLAGCSVEEARQILFAMPDEEVDRCIDHQTGSLREDVAPDRRMGLAFQAVKGALFIDEIDKADDAVRSMLLRFLESREISLPKSPRIVTIPKKLVPLYIFAGSTSRRDMFETLRPIDFWTRISHVIEMPHPLELGSTELVRKTTAEYVKMFWGMHVSDFFEQKNVLGRERKGGDLAPKLYNNLVAPYYEALHRFFVSRTMMQFVASVLSDELIGHGQPVPSVRRIRSAVGRSVFHCFELLVHSRNPYAAIERLKLIRRDELTDESAESWFAAVSDILKSWLDQEATPPLKREDTAFVNSLRLAVEQGAVFQS